MHIFTLGNDLLLKRNNLLVRCGLFTKFYHPRLSTVVVSQTKQLHELSDFQNQNTVIKNLKSTLHEPSSPQLRQEKAQPWFHQTAI